MTRPQIVRADTIDLQDQTSPSAQDHSRKPAQPTQNGVSSVAPHQASEIRQVQKERISEESTLANSWNNVQGLSEEPPSDDDTAFTDVNHSGDARNAQQNGAQPTVVEGSETANGEVEDDMDDDMMDKISSSPSISDGGYISSVWPPRTSSLSSGNSPLVVPLRDCCSGLSMRREIETRSGASSPFVSTPTHFPINHSWGNGTTHLSTVDNIFLESSRVISPCELEDSSSPFSSSPEHFPLSLPPFSLQTEDHHRKGEYAASNHTQGSAEVSYDATEEDVELKDQWGQEEDYAAEERDQISPLFSEQIEQILSKSTRRPLTPMPLEKSPSDMELDLQLLPAVDPLLDLLDYEADVPDMTCQKAYSSHQNAFGDYQTHNELLEYYSDDSDWTTESDSGQSFDSFEFNDDDAEEFHYAIDSMFFCSGWGGECLQEVEDIDFEFVYALHNFVATVEGQANAAKGDTMVLLDDSNSYWWLVRVVKDSTIGYLPAEHIETPTERLARLNKHRNVDLSATMLTDTMEKSKNPLKRAMRRRNAKQVSFTDPTYVEPSDYGYSSDEDDDTESFTNPEPSQGQNGTEPTQEQDNDDITAVAPLNIRSSAKEPQPQVVDKESDTQEDDDPNQAGDGPGSSEDSAERAFGQGRSRNGTLRNTDSFFKDDSVETKKISLTPNLLRDDSSTSTRPSNDLIKERGSSFESIYSDKTDKSKDDKKKKEKKGMLSGLFKRKDKKVKGVDGDLPGSTKTSTDLSRDSPVSNSGENSPTADKSMFIQDGQVVTRKLSKGKLQKPPPGILIQRNQGSSPNPLSPTLSLQKKPSMDSVQNGATASAARDESPEKQQAQTRDLRNGLHSPPAEVTSAKVREVLDVDSSPDSPRPKSNNPFADPPKTASAQPVATTESTGRLSESPVQISAADAHPDGEPPALVRDSSSTSDTDDLQFLRDSPSPPTNGPRATDQSLHPEATAQNHAPQHSPVSPISPLSGPFSGPPPSVRALGPPPPTRSPPPQPAHSPQPFPTLSNSTPTPAPGRQNSTSTITSAGASSAPSTPVWSDASLRQYLDESGAADVRDLLLLTRDMTGVVPAGPDHPLMAGLYAEERGKVQEMGATLDGLLGTWLERKMRSKSSMSQNKSDTRAP